MKANTSATKKAKGARLEKLVSSEYRKIGIEARRMPLSGAISHMRGDIWKKVNDNWVDECKNQEIVKLKDWWEQSVRQSGRSEPVLHISANYRPVITVIRTAKFQDLLLELEDTGQRFLHKVRVVDKARFNLWNEWVEIESVEDYGDSILHLNKLGLTVMSLYHYMEIRNCLNTSKPSKAKKK